jgi:hypothetical protein
MKKAPLELIRRRFFMVCFAPAPRLKAGLRPWPDHLLSTRGVTGGCGKCWLALNGAPHDK